MFFPAQWEVTETPVKDINGNELEWTTINICPLDGFEGDGSAGVEALSQHSTEQLKRVKL